MAIILEKGGDTHRINLEKRAGKPLIGEIVVNLDWNKGGFFKGLLGKAVDLDLGCFYELCNRQKSLIDGLQFSHGRGATAIMLPVRVATIMRLIYGIKGMTEVVVLHPVKQY